MIEFPFKSFTSKDFGVIHKPFAKVRFIHKKHTMLIDTLIDSGADITIMPKSAGEIGLGFRLDTKDKIINLGGAGGGVIPAVVKEAVVEIGEHKFSSRIAWALIDTVPFILGRLDVFNQFDVEIRQKSLLTIFRKSPND